ncbi:MAG: hypothetical protein ACJ71Q_07815, partial [Terriglobales bacterium]
LSLSFFGAGANEADSTISVALMDLGEVQRGTLLGPNQIRNGRSGWLGGLAASDSALQAAGKLVPTANQEFGVMPVTLEGMIIETDKGSKALRFIADVLSSTQSDTAKAISSAVLPSEREKSAQEHTDALEKQREDEEDAYAKYLGALDDLAQLSPGTAATTHDVKQFNVNTTKRIWCTKYTGLQNLGIAPTGRPACP